MHVTITYRTTVIIIIIIIKSPKQAVFVHSRNGGLEV
jgi:hypothetical protein